MRPRVPSRATTIVALLLGAYACAWPPAAARAAGDSRSVALTGGLGITWIGDEAYWNLRLQPEVATGRIGAGLDIDLLVNTATGEIREDDLKFARLLRYLRYARPRDPYYGRIGALDDATLGHGFIVCGYRNQLVENRRKLGLELAVNRAGGAREDAAREWRLQGFASDLGSADLFGIRGEIAPLSGHITTPIASRLRTGTTLVYEEDEDEGKRAGDQDLAALGFDLEFPLREGAGLRTALYVDAAWLLDHGSGRALGLSTEASTAGGRLATTLRLERRWSGAHFMPRYFDVSYEVERYDAESGLTRSAMLDSIRSRNDILGELRLDASGLLVVTGGYQLPDASPRLGTLHLAGVIPALARIDLAADYDRRGIRNGGDLFRLDDRSRLAARAGRPLNRWMRAGIGYEWTYRWDDAAQRYRTVRKVTPAIWAGTTLG